MGSERKSKKRGSSSISEDEGKNKKHRTSDERERKSSKIEKKEKLRRSKKSHKHSKNHSEKGKKSEDKHDRERHKRDRHSLQELSNEDYFSKNNEFSTWLKEERGLFFSDLSSEAARDLFSGFIKEWNSQKLESRYYEGIASGPRTSHNWKIKHKL